MHAIAMMADMEVQHLVIPKTAGVLSAVGGLAADMVADFQRNYDSDSANFDFNGVNSVLEILKREGNRFLVSNGVNVKNQMLEFSVDARYHSQPWDLTIPLRIGLFRDTADVAELVETFHEVHDRMRGRERRGRP